MTFTLIPAASTFTPSVQVSGFDDIGRLTRCDRLVCDFCSSGQCFACGFLQIPPRDGHPCRPASGSPCRVHRGLAPPSHPASTTCTGTAPVKALRAMPGAPIKNPSTCWYWGLGIRRLTMTYSHMGNATLPSALVCFTSEFGMGSGGSHSLSSSGKTVNNSENLKSVKYFVDVDI